MKSNKRKILFWLQVIIIIYCGIGITLYCLQEKILFHPKKLPHNYVFNFKNNFREVNIPVNKTDTINMIKFLPATTAKGLVVYYHGNRENVEHYASFMSLFTENGYEVWMPDYPGFGKSTGERTEKKLYDLAWIIQRMAMSKYHGDSIIIYGKSLGTGIAAYAAANSKCRQLILETPYFSITDMFKHYAFIYPVAAMTTYKIPTAEFLQDVKAPITLIHGTNDEVIYYGSSEKLMGHLKKGDQLITIAGGKHNNLTTFEKYKQVMHFILR